VKKLSSSNEYIWCGKVFEIISFTVDVTFIR